MLMCLVRVRRLPAAKRPCIAPLRTISFLLLLAVLNFAPSSAQQPKRSPTLHTERGAHAAEPLTLTAELQSRLQALESAKQSGDPIAIANSSKSVVAFALREIGSIELAQGSATEAIEAYRRSNDLRESPDTKVDLCENDRLHRASSAATRGHYGKIGNPFSPHLFTRKEIHSGIHERRSNPD